MKKYKYVIVLILSVILALINTPINTMATGANIIAPLQVDYYGTETCSNCKQAEKHFKGLEEKYGVDVVINRYMLSNKTYEEEFLKITAEHNVPTVVPTILVNDEIYQGVDTIENNLENLIRLNISGELGDNIKTEKETPAGVTEIYNNKFKSVTLGVILLASLIDGINPCAIAMLLFFLSLLLALNDKKKVLIAGLSYCAAIFLTYLFIGIGLFKTLLYFSGLNYVLIGIHVVTIIICLVLVVLDAQDYISLKQGKVENVKNALPKVIKHKIHNLLRKQAASKWVFVTTFITGIAVALLEFSCTGQVYIPTITFIINQGSTAADSMKAWMYLIIYNIGFILPILVITIGVYKSNSIMKASNLLIQNRKYVKLVSIVFYTGILIYFIVRLTKLI